MFLMDAIHSTLSLAEVSSQIAEASSESQNKERKLKRTELIEDIFNSTQEEGNERSKKGGERLNLSHTSRVLLTEFQKRAEKFLDQHSDVAKNLEGVGLPDDEFSLATEHLCETKERSSTLSFLSLLQFFLKTPVSS